jgi:phosphoesterase RecJ-like protein
VKPANAGLAPRADRHEDVLPRVAEVLGRAQRVLCVVHAHPDGDAVGSTLGLALALQAAGRDVTLFCPTELPDNLRFLAGLERLVHGLPAHLAFDATTVCDVGASHRIGPGLPERARLGTLVNIDHHLSCDDFGDVNYVDPEAAAVGVLVVRILKEMRLPIPPAAAMALYTSVLTDTGSFRYSSTDPDALHAAAELVAAGADPWLVSSNVYEQQPLARLRLLREVLGTLEVSADGLFASLLVTRDMHARAGSEDGLADGFINYARGIRGVEVAAQLTEPADGGAWRLSFRSRGNVNVAAVAARFGGGGHHNAAGASVEARDLAEVRARVADAVREEFAAAAQASTVVDRSGTGHT